MRRGVVIAALLAFAASTVAKNLEWKDAKVINIVSSSKSAGAAVAPVGTMLVGVPLETNTTLYQIETPEMIYILSYTFNPMVNWRNRPPNLAVNGKTKIAIDGRNAHIIDDDGKDVKVPIVRKIAKNSTQ